MLKTMWIGTLIGLFFGAFFMWIYQQHKLGYM